MRREMGRVLTLYPALQSSVYSQAGNYVSIITPSSGCVFLDSDNLCRIEKEHCKDLKPSVCVLFPFNTINRIGNTVVISPHLKCPLRLELPARAGKVEGTHSGICQLVSDLGFLDDQYLESFAPQLPLHPLATADEVVSRELRFRDICGDRLGIGGFAETLRSASSNPLELDRNVARAARILGLEQEIRKNPRNAIDDLLLGLAPALRLNLLGLPAEGILLALAVGEIVFRKTMTITNNPPTAQGVYTILTGIGPALRLIGLIDEPVGFSKRASVNAPPGWSEELQRATRMILRQAQGSTGALELLERAIPPSFPVIDRSSLLLQIARLIEHSRQSEQLRTSQSV
jgi:hypothetical protein